MAGWVGACSAGTLWPVAGRLAKGFGEVFSQRVVSGSGVVPDGFCHRGQESHLAFSTMKDGAYSEGDTFCMTFPTTPAATLGEICPDAVLNTVKRRGRVFLG